MGQRFEPGPEGNGTMPAGGSRQRAAPPDMYLAVDTGSDHLPVAALARSFAEFAGVEARQAVGTSLFALPFLQVRPAIGTASPDMPFDPRGQLRDRRGEWWNCGLRLDRLLGMDGVALVAIGLGHRPEAPRRQAPLELAELRHRSENMLQTILGLLHLEARRMDDAESGRRLDDLAARVDLLANLHRRLNQTGGRETIDVSELLAELATAQVAPYEGRITLDLALTPLSLDGKRSQALALLVQEALTNAVRHAFGAAGTGRIRLAIEERPGDGVQVTVEDDGREGSSRASSDGLGQRLMHALALRIGGRLLVQDLEPGHAVTVRLPPATSDVPEPTEPTPTVTRRPDRDQPSAR